MSSAPDLELANKAMEFTLDLYKKCSEEKSGENIILSPLSIQTCLSLAYVGAGGDTAHEMSQGLRLVANDRSLVGESVEKMLEGYVEHPMVKIANKVYVKDGYKMKSEFQTIATKQFHSEAQNLDFSKSVESAKTINDWVEDKTNKKIKDLIQADQLNGLTRMVLVNAIYFKGFWTEQFDKKDTKKDDFWISETESVKVDMMYNKKYFKYTHFHEEEFAAIELPYKDSSLSMLILLPDKRTGIAELEDKLATLNLVELRSKMHSRKVTVKLPRFRIEFSINLNDVLKKMGMATMFSHKADFTNLLESGEPLVVSDVVHKAFIEVNEEGAEAAAATGKTIMPRCIIVDPDFFADHPFLYCLWDRKENHTLFFGKLSKL